MGESLTESVCFAVSMAGDLPMLIGDWPEPWSDLANDLLRDTLKALDHWSTASNSLGNRAAYFRGLYATPPEPIAGHSAPSYHELGRILAMDVLHRVMEAANPSPGLILSPNPLTESDFDRVLDNIPAVRKYLHKEAPRFDWGWLVARIQDEEAKAEQRAAGGKNDVDLDRKFMEKAIEEARKSQAEEDNRVHPRVGVVIVKDGKELAVAHRGEQEEGEHAEFTAMEKKLADTEIAGATVYTTLEPCTSRNHPKVPCAVRLIERKVKRVVIGMLDPNPKISGKGVHKLREANIAVELFPHDLMSKIEEMNRDFIRHHKNATEPASPLAAQE